MYRNIRLANVTETIIILTYFLLCCPIPYETWLPFYHILVEIILQAYLLRFLNIPILFPEERSLAEAQPKFEDLRSGPSTPTGLAYLLLA
jgi:hypothetical protein